MADKMTEREKAMNAMLGRQKDAAKKLNEEVDGDVKRVARVM